MITTYESVSKDVLKKITTTEELIDLKALKEEKSSLVAQAEAKPPTDIELIEAGKSIHPYYQDIIWTAQRIKEIDILLGVK